LRGPTTACIRLSSSETMPSSSSNDSLLSGRDAGTTSVGATVSTAPTSSKNKWRRKGRKKLGSVRLPYKRIDIEGQPLDKNTVPGIGHLVFDRNNVACSPENQPAQIESEEMQGTAMSVNSDMDTSGLAVTQNETLIKVIQINAARPRPLCMKFKDNW